MTRPVHDYLSTACRHATEPGRDHLHQVCQAETGVLGAKIPAVCKYCHAPCTCSCHQKSDG